MTSSRERFLDTLEFKPVDKPWVRWGSFLWPETIEVWRTQGYQGELLDDYFGLDRLLRVDPWYGPVPEFRHEVVEEDHETVTYVNHEGILMKEFKEHATASMPQFIKFPVETESEFEQFAAERLALNAGERFSEEWKAQVAQGGRLQMDVGKADGESPPNAAGRRSSKVADVWPRLCWADRWGGFYGSIRNLMGFQGLSYAFYDQPKLIERIMDERTEAVIRITDEVLKHTEFETFWFWEDMACKHGSLVGPEMFRTFALPRYKKVCRWLRDHGIRYIGLDSDGDISTLIPMWLEAGINVLWPFEVQSGMDVLEVRKTYGRDLVLMGGIDKRALSKGSRSMREEVDRVMPLIEEGGYIPEADHSIPPDVAWPDFCEFISYLKQRLQRG